MSKPPPAVNPRSRPSPVRFRGRSFMALVLAPRAPLEQWLGEIDSTLDRSPGFFTGRAVILDVSALQIDRAELSSLIRELHAREIRILGIEGADSSAYRRLSAEDARLGSSKFMTCPAPPRPHRRRRRCPSSSTARCGQGSPFSTLKGT
jgi:Septum formation inhibitor MinC, N-terminal domain